MNWDTKRKVLYAVSTITTIVSIAGFLMRDSIFPEPTCVDRKQNGFESGVDCGGVCSLVCKEDVSPLVVTWSKAVTTKEGVYDLVALVSNSNINNAAKEIGYTFTVYDKNASVMVSLSGSTTVPLDGKFPLIIQNVPLKDEPGNVAVSLVDGPHFTVKESPTSPTVRVLEHRYEDGDISRVFATLRNTKRVEIMDLPVRVMLFDTADNVYAVGQTVVPLIPKEGVKEVTFTWHNHLPKQPVRIEVYPIFNPFEAIGY